jgi:erythronate-4-phosphate dehydrogenase
MKATIIIDDKIPFIKGVLDDKANIIYLNGADINNENVKNADALIIRTRTRCDEKLLKNSSVKYIATATIGFDHIDTEYCRTNNISWTNAPGSNAGSVEQYIASALMLLQQKRKIELSSAIVGIVGVGNVGKRVAAFCKNIGVKTLLNDPPRQRAEKNTNFVSLDEIAEKCNIITFHTPLNVSGEDKTFHLADKHFLASLRKKPTIINAGRGEIIETEALRNAQKQELISGIVLDCWENEPEIDRELLQICDISTPHIAGYSADGKANATSACVQYISKCFDLKLNDWIVKNIPQPTQSEINIDNLQLNDKNTILAKAILYSYNIEEDCIRLKENPQAFEKLRNNYPLRREFSSYSVSLSQENKEVEQLLEKLGFQITNN